MRQYINMMTNVSPKKSLEVVVILTPEPATIDPFLLASVLVLLQELYQPFKVFGLT